MLRLTIFHGPSSTPRADILEPHEDQVEGLHGAQEQKRAKISAQGVLNLRPTKAENHNNMESKYEMNSCGFWVQICQFSPYFR